MDGYDKRIYSMTISPFFIFFLIVAANEKNINVVG